MPDRPIIFSGPMVMALLAGSKTQTRRVLKPQPYVNGYATCPGSYEIICHNDYLPPSAMLLDVKRFGRRLYTASDVEGWDNDLPWQVRDRLWVRETWKSAFADHECTGYRADMAYQCGKVIPHDGPHTWSPSIHMMRWRSRLTLTVTNVRVQRLMDITDDDAKSEGVRQLRNGQWHWVNDLPENVGAQHGYHTPAGAFHELWVEIHGAGSLALNPWVAALTFSVAHHNIDAVRTQREGAHV